MSRADDAVMRLYESADLRDELVDEEADNLLKWAEGELVNLGQEDIDSATFESQVAALLKLVKNVNRFAGRQGQFSAQSDDPLPAAIAEGAAALGRSLTPAQVAAAATGDPAGTVSAAVALLSAKPAAAPAASPAPADAPPAVLPDAPVPPAASSEPQSLSSDEPHFGDTDL